MEMPSAGNVHNTAPGVMNTAGRAISPVKINTVIQTLFASDHKSSDDSRAMNVATKKRAPTPCNFLQATAAITSASMPTRRTLGSRLCKKPDRCANFSDTSASESARAKPRIVFSTKEGRLKKRPRVAATSAQWTSQSRTSSQRNPQQTCPTTDNPEKGS